MPIRSLIRRRAAVPVLAVALAGLLVPAPAASAAVPATFSIGTWNTDLQPWLPYRQQVVDTIAATNLDVLALQEVWTDEARNAILQDPRIKAKYPYSFSPAPAQEPGTCSAFVPISTQEDFINSLTDAGQDTRTIEQPTTAIPFTSLLLGLDLALTSQPCFAAIVNTMQSFPPGTNPLTAIDRAADGTGVRWAHGGSTGQLVLSRTPLVNPTTTYYDGPLQRRVTVQATIDGVRYAFADWPRNRLEDLDPTFGPFQNGALQPQYAQDVVATGADVLLGVLNSAPGYQPQGYDLLTANGYAAKGGQPTYCPTASHGSFPPCQVRERDVTPQAAPDRALDNVMTRSTVSCAPATTFGAATPASDHVGLQVTCRRPFPATGVLDAFARPDGRVGGSWDGLTGTQFHRISGGRLAVQAGGPLVWRTAFGPAQETFVTLRTVARNGPAQGLLLKVQAASVPDAGAISVAYDARARAVRVSALRVGARAWTAYPAIPVTLADGDVLGARALPNGDVEVYRNGTLLGAPRLNAADAAFFNPKGGRIGLWSVSSQGAVLDDFGGGSLG